MIKPLFLIVQYLRKCVSCLNLLTPCLWDCQDGSTGEVVAAKAKETWLRSPEHTEHWTWWYLCHLFASLVRWELEPEEPCELMDKLSWYMQQQKGDPVLRHCGKDNQYPRLSDLHGNTMVHMLVLHEHGHACMHTQSFKITWFFFS